MEQYKNILKGMVFVFVSLIISIYLTVYLHELGHSFVAFSYSCKENPLIVTITPTIMESNDNPYKKGCWESLSPLQQSNIALGGLLSSGLFGTLFLFLIRSRKIKNAFLLFLIFFLGLLNFMLLTSYLVAGPFEKLVVAENLFSDVALIIANTGTSPLIFSVAGIFIAIFVWYMYQKIDLSNIIKIKKKNWKILFHFAYVFLLIILVAARLIL